MTTLTSYTNTLTNSAAIGLSFFCVLHCLATPLLLVLFPSLMATQIGSESIHLWLLIGVVPTSLISLGLGCKQHKSYRVAALGVCGLLLLLSALLVEDLAHGHLLEKVLTVIGAVLIAIGHYWNYRLCRDGEDCRCAVSADA